ncbi:MAG: penicillin acylase family protein, partial [Chloroflexi bacterium]|nr:penicillin acylase family protein [Chloroflexota bacterium]
MATDTKPDYAAAVSQRDGDLAVDGLAGAVVVRRDAFGIPHIEARGESDAWFGMGFASAQDRLWQMEWYRRRGTGRWSELVGPSGLESDRMFRRFRLDAAARVDVDAMTADTRAMFDAYAAGVNAFLQSGQPLPVEYALTESAPEPWEPWHSVLIFKVRHAIMGKRGIKLARTELLRRVGPETYGALEHIQPAGLNVILPPGGATADLIRLASDELSRVAAGMGTLASDEGGSNSWVIAGSRTTTGKPVLCNDSHRPLDVPNVYWQAHVTCPQFNAAGAAFPGFPAFPHFGHNGHLAWNITHGQADNQDLYVEQFDPDQPERYRIEDGWADAAVHRDEIRVRGGSPEPITVVETRHGTVIHGEPSDGQALVMRYTATDRVNRQWETLRPMLMACTVEALHESQRGWEEPVNSLLSADEGGSIGFLFRGRIPVRASTPGHQFAVPGWTGEHEWIGDVPFDALPQAINPPEGFVGTANQRVWDHDDPYIAFEFSTPGRSTRIAEVLGGGEILSPEAIAALQGDTLSVRARGWARFLERQPAATGAAERARSLLAAWDGDLKPGSAAALLYAHFRIGLARTLFEPIVGAETWTRLSDPANTGGAALIGQWLYFVGADLEQSVGTPDGRPWADVLPAVLERVWTATATLAGDEDPAAWRWGDVHQTEAAHTLAAVLPQHAAELNPPAVTIGGDGDTLQVSGYSLDAAAGFRVSALSVYRQVVDFARPDEASWVIPGGASGLPTSEHAHDQLEHWRRHERIPMHIAPEAARA